MLRIEAYIAWFVKPHKGAIQIYKHSDPGIFWHFDFMGVLYPQILQYYDTSYMCLKSLLPLFKSSVVV